ncbi:MAG: UDP-3-O-(3-hydroxymyristoyl)glucosamine N-acyltransferase [Paracoccaceae bacterium]
MAAQTIRDIAAALGAEAFGNGDLVVGRPSEPAEARDGDLALAMSPAYADALANSAARAAIVYQGCDWQAMGLEAAIAVPRARLALAQLTQVLDQGPVYLGVHPTAIIDETAQIGNGVHIGPFTCIGARSRIGDGAWIDSHVSIDEGVQLGQGALVRAGVRIGRNVTLGRRVILQANAAIGFDGFSYATADASNEERAFRTAGRTALDPPADAIRHRVHSLGSVVIGDDVEIGANAAVDAGTIRPTRIGRGTKIDNLVQIGHNVTIGQDCVFSAQSAIAGSARIGDRCVFGGKSGCKDNITIGSDVVLGGAAIALEDVASGRFVMGYPARPMPVFRSQEKALRRLSVPKDK